MNETATNNSEDLLLAGASDRSIDFQPMMIALARSKFLILGCGLLAVLAVWLYLMHVPPTFKADTEILPPQIARGNSVNLLSQSAAASSDSALGGFAAVMGAKNQSDSFVVILSAWPILDALVKQFDLQQVYGLSNAADARYRLESNTYLKATKEGFITISILDTDRKRSAAIANAYVDQAREFLRGLSLSEASQRRVFYEVQMAKTKEDLAQAEIGFQRMQQTTGMVSIDAQARTLLETAAGLRSQITAKEVQLQSLRGYSTEVNPQVQIAETELNALRGQLAQLEAHGQGGYSGKSISSVPGTETEFVRATRELKYQEALYDLMVKQYEGSRIDEAREAPVIQVIEPALVPDHKFGPRRWRDVRYAFGAGLALGLIIALVRYWRSTIKPASRARWAELRRAAFRW